ncbi:Mpo1-like protein [Allohahella sp. A8]|uniref:Mpo1-like protein n=1 Tax=Allohahella sp. A8 TaxID=3141461 RepID=UPI000C0ACDC9|nr:hypothetical protein [Hahellaceae bacterium]|tara:strand:+ start:71954 stop:72277 length:324 start_codon:yes stop_codon:yes gene_type:complete
MTTEPKQIGNFASFSEFYPYYLREHSNIQCRRLHFIGTSLVIATFLVAIFTAKFKLLLLLPVLGYLPAWIGHFFFEHNRPATFKHPLYSLLADFVMYRDILLNRVHI